MLNAPPIIDSEKRHNTSPRSESLSKRSRERLCKYSLFDMTMITVSSLISSFTKSHKKKINELLETEVFSIAKDIFQNIRIFNSYFMNNIKHKSISKAYEKS